MNANVLNKTIRISPLTNFYLNKRVNILHRIKSFARRIRIHCKLHNELIHGRKINLIDENRSKLQNDDLDYFNITKFMVEDLIMKSSYLSNHDSILILDILSRIKKPLEMICSTSNKLKFVENKQNFSSKKTFGLITKIISDCQKSLLKYLLESENNKTMTNFERYYMIISLSRECGLITPETWLKLFENVQNVLETKTPDSPYGYKPFEIANLLLIYDQISRWYFKRQQKNPNNSISDEGGSKYLSETEDYNQLQNYGHVEKVENGLIPRYLQRKKCNPFKLDIINIGIYRIENYLSHLKPEKIIKLLYLVSSRQSYSNKIFQNALVHFESEGILKILNFSLVSTLFNTFSTAYTFHFLSYIETFMYDNDLERDDLTLISQGKFNLLNSLNNSTHYLEGQGNMDLKSQNIQNDEIYKFKVLESFSFCTTIVSLEYLRRICVLNPSIFSDIEGFSLIKRENFEKSHEWNDIFEFLDKRLNNIENVSTHIKPESIKVLEFSKKVGSFIYFNQILVNLFKINHKYNERIKRPQFLEKIFTLLQSHINYFSFLDNFKSNDTKIKENHLSLLDSKESQIFHSI